VYCPANDALWVAHGVGKSGVVSTVEVTAKAIARINSPSKMIICHISMAPPEIVIVVIDEWQARLDRGEVTRGCRRAGARAGANTGKSGDPKNSLSTTTLYQQQLYAHLKFINLSRYPVAMLATCPCQSLACSLESFSVVRCSAIFFDSFSRQMRSIAATSFRPLFPNLSTQIVVDQATGCTKP
jgi:hypothetical protein